jgi:hypothetical protein
MRQQLIAFYLEWRNDFLTVERFAEYHNITMEDAHDLIKMGKFYLFLLYDLDDLTEDAA